MGPLGCMILQMHLRRACLGQGATVNFLGAVVRYGAPMNFEETFGFYGNTMNFEGSLRVL